MNSQGGVYIAGGIVPRFIDYLQASDFRTRFESKGRLSAITEQAPTYVITEEQPGFTWRRCFYFTKTTKGNQELLYPLPLKMQVSESLRNFNSRRCDERMVIPL